MSTFNVQQISAKYHHVVGIANTGPPAVINGMSHLKEFPVYLIKFKSFLTRHKIYFIIVVCGNNAHLLDYW